MSSLDKHDAEKIKKYIERDKYSKLKRFLSSEKIDVNEIITKKGEKMLHLAAKEGSSFCLEFLLEQGANPRLVDKKGNMPLHRALKFVIENYSNSNEKCLVNTLLTYSSKFLDVENFDGITPRHLIKKLEKIKSDRNGYSSTNSISVEEEDLPKTEDDLWRDRLKEECDEEYADAMGKFETFSGAFDEPSSESFDNWADRIFEEYMSKKKKSRVCVKPRENNKDDVKRNKDLKPEIDLDQAKKNYDLLKQKKKFDKQRKLCQEMFSSNNKILYSNLPFKDVVAEDILDIILHDCNSDPVLIKKRIREELLKWHPDKFKQKFGSRIDQNETENVMSHVKHISQVLINYGK